MNTVGIKQLETICLLTFLSTFPGFLRDISTLPFASGAFYFYVSTAF